MPFTFYAEPNTANGYIDSIRVKLVTQTELQDCFYKTLYHFIVGKKCAVEVM